MISIDNSLIAIEWLFISLLFFENRWIGEKTVTKIIFDFSSFVLRSVCNKSKLYWRLLRLMFDLIDEAFFFLPKIIKFLVIFHYLFNFVCNLYMIVVTITILYEIPKYILKLKNNMLPENNQYIQLFLKYSAVFFMFSKYDINKATFYLALMFIVDFIKIRKKKQNMET